jgi:ketosteroid isomerase-like protein
VKQEPKEIVKEVVDAYNSKSLERLLDLYHPGASFWDPFHRDGVRGRDAIAGVVGRLFEAMPDELMHIRTLAADERHAVVELRSVGTAPDGGFFELEFTEVYEVSGGRVASCRVYIDPEEVPSVDQPGPLQSNK